MISCLIIFVIGSNGPQKFCIEKVGKETWLPRSHTWYVENSTAVPLPWLETYSFETRLLTSFIKQQTTKLPFLGKFDFPFVFLHSHQLDFCSCQENRLFLPIYKGQ